MEKKKGLAKKGIRLMSKKGSLGAPDFDSMLQPSGLPGLPDAPVADAETIVNKEVDDMMAQIREGRKNNAERFRDVESGEFWFCVCFQSRAQKEKFIDDLLAKYSPHDTQESFGNKYVSGLELAALLDIPVEPIVLEIKKSRLAPKDLRETEVI